MAMPSGHHESDSLIGSVVDEWLRHRESGSLIGSVVNGYAIVNCIH